MNKRKVAKRYLELMFNYEQDNGVMFDYNSFKESQRKRWKWLENDYKNLSIILKDTKYITNFIDMTNKYGDWKDICETIKSLEKTQEYFEILDALDQ